jgi:signal transduction histidine kinase
MHPSEPSDRESRWLAMALAMPTPPVPPDISCAEVYERMEQEPALFAAPIVARDEPLGLVDRITLMSQFARPYWREVFARRPITKLMDPAPVIVDVMLPIEAISRQMTDERRSALHAGFIVTSDGRYFGIASTVDLLRLSADHAHLHARELGRAHAQINGLNRDLERRVDERTAELRAAQDELLRKERLSTLGQLTATVAHELRNPLSAIRNTLFTLKDALSRAQLNLDRPLGRMERSIARCDGIIGDLLDYTRIRELRCRAVIGDQWLDEMFVEHSIPAGIALVHQFGASGCRVNIDTDRMRQVVVNLLDNAVQAMLPADGNDASHRILIATRLAQAGYELTIEDNGPGIPADVLPRVFEPLFSTKSFGTGLGLPTVKQIVEQHGGAIAIASETGAGTRVTVTLPSASAKELAA